MSGGKLVFVHAADLHLDSPLRGLPDGDEHTDAIRSASRRALVKLVDETIAAQAAFLIVAGDIWDGDWQDLRTGNFFIGQMRRLHENDVDVFIVLGNHDLHGAWQEQLRHTVPDNVVIFASAAATSVKREYRGLKVAIHGQSYERANQENNLAIGYPRRDAGVDFNVGILHTSLAGHSGGHDRYAPCALDDLRSRGYDYWALGHVHQRKTVTEPGEPPIAYAGVLQGRQFRESGAKGAYLVGCNFASGRPDVRLAPLDVADVVWSEVEVDLAGLERKEEMSAAVEQRLRSLANDNSSILCNVVRIALRNVGSIADSLVFNPDELRERFSANAAAVSGRLAVGKVTVEHASRPPAEVAGGLLGCLHEVAGDASFRSTLAEQLENLMHKVPGEVRTVVAEELGVDAGVQVADVLADEAARSLIAALAAGKKD